MKIYLAIPYTGYEKLSFKTVNKYTARLMNQGHIVFSPISHTHSISIQEKLPGTWQFWEEQDRSFIEWCDEVHIVDVNPIIVLDSTGVQGEIVIADELFKPIKYIEVDKEDKWGI